MAWASMRSSSWAGTQCFTSQPLSNTHSLTLRNARCPACARHGPWDHRASAQRRCEDHSAASAWRRPDVVDREVVEGHGGALHCPPIGLVSCVSRSFGVMWDFPDDPDVHRLCREVYEAGLSHGYLPTRRG